MLTGNTMAGLRILDYGDVDQAIQLVRDFLKAFEPLPKP